MPPAEALASAPPGRRQTVSALAGLAALTTLAAIETRWIGGAMMRPGSPFFVPDGDPWGAAQLATVALMWSVMMVAMMVPSAAPMALAFVGLERRRRPAPWRRTGAFLAGYLVVWIGFSLLAALAQWGLRSAELLAPGMRTASPWLGGALLVAAGLFQFSAAKSACLHHCRTPVGFLLAEWRDGLGGALRMGLRHGAYCTGCCWLLMSVLFVAGVMNAAWCAALAALVLAEKALPRSLWLARLAGAALIAWGLALGVGAV